MKTETTEREDTEEARTRRVARWRRRGLCTARQASDRFARAAAILLRAALNFHRAQRRRILRTRPMELRDLREACDELHGGRALRGIVLGREAADIARMICPPQDGPGADYPVLTVEEIKAAYALARNFAASAKLEQEDRQHRAQAMNACRKFFDVLGKLLREQKTSSAPVVSALAA